MKNIIYYLSFLIIFVCSTNLDAQKDRPSYCDQLPASYEKGATTKRGTPRQPLPKFSTQPRTEHKIQVAILRNTDPAEYPFHSKLVARYRPCEEVWVIESRESFSSRSEAEKLKAELRNAGYKSAYITDIIGYY